MSDTENTLSPELQELLDNCPGYEGCNTPEEYEARTSEMAAEIKASVAELEKDPEWIASYWKMSFGESLLQFMDAEGISKEEMAKRLNKSLNQINRIINGTSQLTLLDMASIFVAAGVGDGLTFTFKNKTPEVEAFAEV